MNCDDALPLEKVPPVANQQRLAIASVTNAVNFKYYELVACTRHVSIIAVCSRETYFPLPQY